MPYSWQRGFGREAFGCTFANRAALPTTSAAGLTNCAMGYEVAKQQNIPRVLDLPQFYPELSAQFKYAKNIDGFLGTLCCSCRL